MSGFRLLASGHRVCTHLYGEPERNEPMPREDRVHELCELKQTNPQRIIVLYRDALNTVDLGQLPHGIGFTGMIEVIIRHEVEVGVIASP